MRCRWTGADGFGHPREARRVEHKMTQPSHWRRRICCRLSMLISDWSPQRMAPVFQVRIARCAAGDAAKADIRCRQFVRPMVLPSTKEGGGFRVC
jgi:hypothetical protein